MPAPVKTGAPIIGIIFLLLALFKFVQGGNWVVWLILGLLFGGLRFIGSNKRGADKSEHKA